MSDLRADCPSVLDFYCHQVFVEQEERDGKTMVLIKRRAHGGSADDAAG